MLFVWPAKEWWRENEWKSDPKSGRREKTKKRWEGGNNGGYEETQASFWLFVLLPLTLWAYLKYYQIKTYLMYLSFVLTASPFSFFSFSTFACFKVELTRPNRDRLAPPPPPKPSDKRGLFLSVVSGFAEDLSRVRNSEKDGEGWETGMAWLSNLISPSCYFARPDRIFADRSLILQLYSRLRSSVDCTHLKPSLSLSLPLVALVLSRSAAIWLVSLSLFLSLSPNSSLEPEGSLESSTLLIRSNLEVCCFWMEWCVGDSFSPLHITFHIFTSTVDH